MDGVSSSIIKRAENVVGYPTSFLNLRWLLNDEVANIGAQVKKLLATKHPVLKTTRQLLLPSTRVPSWGLIVLLVSKLIDRKSYADDTFYAQRVVAESVEMLRTSNLLHKSITRGHNDSDAETAFGNKMSLLGGDYLLARSFKEIATIRDVHVQELMSAGVRDTAESQFFGPRNADNNAIPARPNPDQLDIEVPDCYATNPIDYRPIVGNMRSEWTLRNLLDCGHLLARACQSVLGLIDWNDAKIANCGYRIGRNYALFERAHNDLMMFGKDKWYLTSAPIMLHLEDEPSFYNRFDRCSSEEIDYDRINEVVLSNSYGLRKTRELKFTFLRNVVGVLEQFPESGAKDALIDIMEALNSINN